MGSRLGVLLKTYSGWEIYYNHSAAQTVGLDIAIDGMEATYERVRRMSPMGVDDPHAWTGATWIEGTLLIDETRKLVVWAEESEALYMPRLIRLFAFKGVGGVGIPRSGGGSVGGSFGG